MVENGKLLLLAGVARVQINILNFSDTVQDDGTFRLDAEHYQKHYLKNQNKLTCFGSQSLSEIIKQPVMTGHTPSMKIESYYGGNIGFVKTDNLREFRISGQFSHLLSSRGNEVIKRTSLQEGDLIVTIIGATQKIVGRAALIRKQDLPLNINQNIALIRVKKSASPQALSIYLNSKVGKLALWFLSRQTEQTNLNCREIEKVLVPKFSEPFITKIENLYRRAIQKETISEALYEEAQDLLLIELGLYDWQPTHRLTFIKDFSNTREAGRIDAEYFQPKYDEIIHAIKSYKGGCDRLESLVTLKDRNFSTNDTRTYQYIELANIAGYGKITDCTTDKGQNLPTRARRKVNTGDVIVSSIEGSLSSIALINHEYNNALCSTGFYIISSEELNSETLLVFLKSTVGQLQLKKGCSGTILTAINKDKFSRIILPKIQKTKQQEIQQKVTESFELHKQSKQLLEKAKHAVEMAIEKDERQAMEILTR